MRFEPDLEIYSRITVGTMTCGSALRSVRNFNATSARNCVLEPAQLASERFQFLSQDRKRCFWNVPEFVKVPVYLARAVFNALHQFSRFIYMAIP